MSHRTGRELRCVALRPPTTTASKLFGGVQASLLCSALLCSIPPSLTPLSHPGYTFPWFQFICFYSEYTSALGHLKQVAHFCFVTVERYCSGNEDSANYTFLNWFELFQVPLPYLIRGGDRVRYGLCGMLW
ncbi:uncharacterized protein [Physcomitrium patens]|uniref:uncharacterized protein isoform X2 n=1 Tax=Physcomitrium patens TaxID=3218 RepID=UPI003CCE3E86